MPAWPKSIFTLGASVLTARAARRLRRTKSDVPAQERTFRDLTARLGTTSYWRAAGIEPGMAYEAFRKRMEVLGIEYGEAKNLLGAGSAQLFVVDPEGHTWEFQEPFPKR